MLGAAVHEHWAAWRCAFGAPELGQNGDFDVDVLLLHLLIFHVDRFDVVLEPLSVRQIVHVPDHRDRLKGVQLEQACDASER